MIKRALIAVALATLLPSLAHAAPVKRFRMRGTAIEQIKRLNGEVINDQWSTSASITETGSTVTIKFRDYDGTYTTQTLSKGRNGYRKDKPWREIKSPSGYAAYFCEIKSAQVFAMKRNIATYGGVWDYKCESGFDTKKGYNAIIVKLRK